MDLRIAGKKALMAGGSAGMGRATAERLAEAGVELYISARREERLIKAAKEIAHPMLISIILAPFPCINFAHSDIQ